jgi:hypothetical protein
VHFNTPELIDYVDLNLLGVVDEKLMIDVLPHSDGG